MYFIFAARHAEWKAAEHRYEHAHKETPNPSCFTDFFFNDNCEIALA